MIDQNGMTGGDEDDHDPQEIAVAHIFDLALKKKLSPSSVGPFTQGSTVSFDIVILNLVSLIRRMSMFAVIYVQKRRMTLVNPGTTLDSSA
ncbi:MAG: hypothetical protein IPL98_13145 [Saprospiraceae bacterium]|nr:hypothetical protein [Saprospiraceae bacterium]